VKNSSLLSQDFAPGQLPQGERGETGQQGDRGPAGPTDGSASASLNNAPPAYADTEGPHAETNVTLAAPGKLFVSGTTQTQIDCDPTPPGGCLDRWGLYVDGQPVPGSGRTLFIDAGGSELAEFTLLGVAAGQPAGSRHVELRRQLTGPWAGRGGGHRQVAGIALGG
jgi:hypothetical protein